MYRSLTKYPSNILTTSGGITAILTNHRHWTSSAHWRCINNIIIIIIIIIILCYALMGKETHG